MNTFGYWNSRDPRENLPEILSERKLETGPLQPACDIHDEEHRACLCVEIGYAGDFHGRYFYVCDAALRFPALLFRKFAKEVEADRSHQ